MNDTPSTPGSAPPPPPPPPPAPASGGAASDGAPDPIAAPPRPALDGRERALAPNVRTSWRLTVGLSILPIALGICVIGFVVFGHWGWLVVVGTVGLVVAILWGYLPLRYRRWRWQLAELAVELRYGVLIYQQETVPYFRIQQIDIVQGPLDRLLHLATLQVTTASASGSASLPGIEAAHAPEVRAELLARAAAAVADHPGDLRDAV